MILFEAVHYAKPVPQSRARAGKFGFYYGKRASMYRAALIKTLVVAGGNGFDPINEPVCIYIMLAGANPTSDVDNHAKMVLDALQDANILKDDSIKVVWKLVVKRTNAHGPCTEIRITKHEGEKDGH